MHKKIAGVQHLLDVQPVWERGGYRGLSVQLYKTQRFSNFLARGTLTELKIVQGSYSQAENCNQVNCEYVPHMI